MRSDSWQIEADFVPETLDGAVELHDQLIAAGNSRAFAAGLVMWLTTRAASGKDTVNGVSRSAYRRALAELPTPTADNVQIAA